MSTGDDGERMDPMRGPEPDPQRRGPRPQTSTATVRAQDILGSAGVLQIDLDGEIYTLRLTRNRRLILTK